MSLCGCIYLKYNSILKRIAPKPKYYIVKFTPLLLQ